MRQGKALRWEGSQRKAVPVMAATKERDRGGRTGALQGAFLSPMSSNSVHFLLSTTSQQLDYRSNDKARFSGSNHFPKVHL